MITVTPVRSPDYYLEQVARDRHDYLSGEGEAPGRWEGTWAHVLGVNGEVTEEQFRAMFEERHPVTGERLKKYENKKVAGWDITFSPPKSISALWAIALDEVAEQIREADRVARQLGLAQFERYACIARLGHNGVDRQPALGFLAAAYEHRLSRDGDPQLHTHEVVANAVEAHDGRTAALDGTMLYRWQKASDAVYQAALRAELTARLGVTWVERAGVWEIDGIPPALCRLWSKRRAAIEAELAEHGTSGGRAAQAAALATRKPKVTEDTRELRQRLLDEASDAGFDLDSILAFVLDRARHRYNGDGLVGLSDAEIVDYLVGPEGLTAKASGFGRRDVLAGIGALLIADAPDGQAAADRIDRIAETFFADHRVLGLRDPVRKTSGEVIRPRDEHGKVMREVCLEQEPRFTTASLLAAETELITRAKGRQDTSAAVVPDHVVARVIAVYNAAHPGRELDADQQAMIWQLCSSGNGVDIVVGKAGTGKSTALEVARQCFEAAGIPVIGVAPTANAARQLEKASGIPACTLDKLLVEVANGVRELPDGVAVVHDEAGMTATRNRLALQQLVDAVGGKVADVGDHRQIPSVDAGGGHAVLARELGAITLGVDHRFKLPALRDAAELIRDGHAQGAIALLVELGMVHEYCQPDQRAEAMIEAWLSLRDQPEPHDVRMLATENAVVERLNLTARAALIDRGEVSRRGHTYVSDDHTRDIRLAIGDRVRLGRNDGYLLQPDGTRVTVRNGMEGTITALTRRGITVQLDPGEDLDRVILSVSYVGECVDYAYALTANKAQGMTVDHVLFGASAASSQETAYTALSRGRYSNHVFAVIESGWEEALEVSKAQTFASDQHPVPDHSLAEASRQSTVERGSDVRLRLLAAHQSSRAASPTAALSRDADRVAARKQRQQHEQSGRQSHEAQRRERNRQGRRDDGPRIGM
ncbi:MAG: MobF family relaxase [Egibacteraceae bacterium]